MLKCYASLMFSEVKGELTGWLTLFIREGVGASEQ
jgi:hypothetical protein